MSAQSRLPIVLWMLFTLVPAAPFAQNTPAESAAAATAPVQQLLDQGIAVSNGGDAPRALELADRALALAQQADDPAGQAQAHRLRAHQLLKLSRSTDALAAWRDAETAWKRAGDGPGQVEAIGWQASLVMSGSAEQGGELLRRAIALAESEASRPRASVSALVDVGFELVDRSLLNEARRTYQAALSIAERSAPDSLEVASSLNGLGFVAQDQGNLTAARGYYERALALREKLAPDSVDIAKNLNNLGTVLRNQGDLSAARELHQKALAIAEKLASGSLPVVSGLNGLGILAWYQGDLSAARDYYQRSLSILERLAPNSMSLASGLNNLGLVARQENDLGAARNYYQRSVAIYEKRTPNSMALSNSLNNLGVLAFRQGDLNIALGYYERALSIRQKLAPDSLPVAGSFNNLGNVALLQGDLTAALDYFERALAIKQKLAPNSLDVAVSLQNLGLLARLQGDSSGASDYHRRVQAIQDKLAPNSADAAQNLDALGRLAQDRNDLSAARSYHERALAITNDLAPNSLDVAEILVSLGFVAEREGDLGAARSYYNRALVIREQLSPKSLDLAQTLRKVGALEYKRADVDSAIQHTSRAWTIVRSQAASIAGDEARQAFESQYLFIGSQLIKLQGVLGRIDDAFVTLEEGRAQALARLLSERGIARRLAPSSVWRAYELAQGASNRAGTVLEEAGLAEEKARLALEAEIAQQSAADIVQEKRGVLAELAKKTEAARQAYTRTRVEAERRWADVTQTIRTALPPPIDPGEARRALPPDTLLAAFALGEEGNTLFLVARDGPVRAFPLTIPLEQLAARVKFVRETTSREAGARGLAVPGADDVRNAAARSLFAQLFPAEARQAIGKAKRLLLSPDGVLWDLPFAALVINDQGKPRYLGLETPLMYTQSLTAFAQAVQTSGTKAPRKPAVLIVGNPLYDNALRTTLTRSKGKPVVAPVQLASAKTRAQGELALLAREGEIPAPLPHAEEEANQIAALYGARASTGVEPTEAWFRQRAADADVIHLATHGYFNEFRAVSSGVRLAVPENPPDSGDTHNDGALQAWEVFTQFQLRADIVVLSACETGVGSQVPGEGLVGLTRAFQAAGAASVVATQWRVADRSTAGGMVAFHQGLRKGLPKDEALRLAMRKLAGDPTTSHPSYWAPFVLIGDFRALRSAAANSSNQPD